MATIGGAPRPLLYAWPPSCRTTRQAPARSQAPPAGSSARPCDRGDDKPAFVTTIVFRLKRSVTEHLLWRVEHGTGRVMLVSVFPRCPRRPRSVLSLWVMCRSSMYRQGWCGPTPAGWTILVPPYALPGWATTGSHGVPPPREEHSAWSTRAVTSPICRTAVPSSPGRLCKETVTALRPSEVVAGHTK